MSILYVVTNLFQLVIFTALTGVLFAIAAVSLLMEATIVHFVHPMTNFMLYHSGKLAILAVKLSANFTHHAYKRVCAMDSAQSAMDRINLRTPEIPYARSALSDLVEETQPLRQDIESVLEQVQARTASTDETTDEQTKMEETASATPVDEASGE